MEFSPFSSQEDLSAREERAWLSVTQNFVEQYLQTELTNPQIIQLEIVEQCPGSSLQNTNGCSRRFMQEVSGDTLVDSLVLEFEMKILYNAATEESDLNQLVWSAFEAPGGKQQYISELKGQAGGGFVSVQAMEIAVEGYVPPTSGPDRPVNVAVIAGASVGSVALVVLVMLLFLRNRSSKSLDDNKVSETQATPSTSKNVKVSTEILVEPQDDVSTLGDPMFGQGMMMGGMEKDEMTATVGDDYDYTKHYRNSRGPLSLAGTTNTRDRTISEDMSKMSSVQSLSMSKLGKMGENFFADDASFEEQFTDPEERLDVVAPAGKLGMVIDTPNGGTPVVHAIKDTSVLIDQVRVGDRLLSVDGEDCAGMTAMQVSKLISLKSEKPARVLVFARSSTNTNQPR